MQAIRKPELAGLHLVRGVCALTVMFYHYLHATNVGTFYSAGLYGVYLFFVLSGFALYYVYGADEVSERGLKNFYIARLFRIAPLYVAVATYKFIQMGANPENAYRYLMNVSLLFGLGNPGATASVGGGWSIGIEVVFYLLFPVLLLFRSINALAAVFVITLVLNHALAELTFDLSPDPHKHWSFYTQPLTFLCYFVGGMLLAKIGEASELLNSRDKSLLPAAVLLLMALIFAGPHLMGWSREEILTGWMSKVLIFACFVVVAASASLRLQGIWRSVAIFLGDVSYAVYLIHILVFAIVRRHGLDTVGTIAASAVITIVLSALIYRYYEAPMRSLQWRFRGAAASPA